jgi:hypothetical protein
MDRLQFGRHEQLAANNARLKGKAMEISPPGCQASVQACCSSPILFRLALDRRRVGVLELQPIWRTPGSVTRSKTLRNNSFEAHPAGVLEHDDALRVLHVFVQPHTRPAMLASVALRKRHGPAAGTDRGAVRGSLTPSLSACAPRRPPELFCARRDSLNRPRRDTELRSDLVEAGPPRSRESVADIPSRG